MYKRLDYKGLNEVKSSKDIKKFSFLELYQLAKELRLIILDVVSKNGGHLASNLGVVELTIALHYVFSPPFDKIIWDVGHQSYVHKLITDRKNYFTKLRKFNNISGFSRKSESQHDIFTTGHSSTSISAGLGIAYAKKLYNSYGKIIVVIGDGSLTAGLAYESMNQIQDTYHNKNLVLVLNDNNMSISKNVGVLSSLLIKSFSKEQLKKTYEKFSFFDRLYSVLENGFSRLEVRKSKKHESFFINDVLFKIFNIKYLGPINGHNLEDLINILENISNIEEPILLHVMTKKGKGYKLAEKNPVYFHGVEPFNIFNGVKNTRKIHTNTEIFGNAMIELASNNEKIIAVTAAMSEGTGLRPFKDLFPDRFFDVGIAEQHGVTFAAGMSIEGYVPIVAIYSTFLQRAYDQILHDICTEKLPVIFAIDRSGIVGRDGITHHGLFDLSYLRSMPNMVIMAPKDENELRNMLYTAVRYNGPISLRYSRGKISILNTNFEMTKIPIGKAELLAVGSDVLFIAIGSTVSEAVMASNLLRSKHKIFVTVVNARFVKPLDGDMIGYLAKKINIIITIEENILSGGFGTAVLEFLLDNNISVDIVRRIGIKDVFMKHGNQDELRFSYDVNVEFIINTVLKLLKK